jgi:ATP-dependent Clp protease ATP-binding subunit ClpA
MTSNLGSEILMNSDFDSAKPRVLSLLRTHFRPEFLNRIDDVVMFKPLSREDIKRIVNIQLNEIRKRLSERRITLEVSESLKEHFASAGYDAVFGARPLKRTIQKNLLDLLSKMVIQGKIKDGDRVIADFKDGKVEINLK